MSEEKELTRNNSDSRLLEQAEALQAERQQLGLEGLTGDLAFVLIQTEADRHEAAVAELLRYTGHDLADAFLRGEEKNIVLRHPASADILVQTGRPGPNPFLEINRHPKSEHLPNTRLETLVFHCKDIEAYRAAQLERGTRFLSDEIQEWGSCRFLQSEPSPYTGNSVGVVEFLNGAGNYRGGDCITLATDLCKPEMPWAGAVSTLDHIATRVRAADRDPAILEYMGLTNYSFAFAIYVPELNSITNVARCEGARFAQVFTSGIHMSGGEEGEGPTEAFVRNYGARVHHMAFLTEEIGAMDEALREDGLNFLSDLVGSEEDGIRQSFSVPSPNTLLVNEYIQRFGDFDGFFTQQNVTLLTEASGRQ
jgi:hypothetical protein